MPESNSIEEPETTKSSPFSRFTMPLIKKGYPSLSLAQALNGVQPMKLEDTPAPADVIGGICLWVEEEFGEFATIETNYQTGIIRISFDAHGRNYGLQLLYDKIRVESRFCFYEDPNLFDKLRAIIKKWKSRTSFDPTNHWQVKEDAEETTFFEC
jgi:hypothetical protein